VRTFHAATMTELHDKMCTALVEGTETDLDVISSVDVQIHNVIAEAESMDWDFDMKDMWLTKSRWTMMVNQYLDPEELEAWIKQITSKIGTKNRGICMMRTKTVAARGGEATGHKNKETRRWGSCMLAISYKAIPAPQITLYSRTSYLGYIGALDLTVAWMAAKYLADALGIDVKDIRFVWMNEAVQWHNFKSLAFLLNHPEKKRRKAYRRLMMKPLKKLSDEERATLDASPGLTLSRKWLAKVIKEDKDGVTYGDMTYNTYRRIRRRWHTEVLGFEKAQEFEGWSYYKSDVGDHSKGDEKEFFKAYQPLPSVPSHTLNFDGLVKKHGIDLGGAEFEGGGMEDDDDED
jgi:hypothetical protein